jgi:hypothetical protein
LAACGCLGGVPLESAVESGKWVGEDKSLQGDWMGCRGEGNGDAVTGGDDRFIVLFPLGVWSYGDGRLHKAFLDGVVFCMLWGWRTLYGD